MSLIIKFPGKIAQQQHSNTATATLIAAIDFGVVVVSEAN